MHRYLVRYIEREGNTDKIVVWAHTKGEARQKAADHGCEDILKVRRVGVPIGTLVVITLILDGIVYLFVK